MIHYKTQEEIEVICEGGRRLREVVNELLPSLTVGVKTIDIDTRAEKLLIAHGGEPSFNKVKGYKWSTCLPINEQVVHTPPSDRVLLEGDVLTVDIGMYYKGFHTDYADTILIGKKKDKKIEDFLQAGKNTLTKAIQNIKVGEHIGKISEIIQREIEGHGYHVLKELTGHGVGRDLHEDPFIPGYVDKPIQKTPVIKPGLVIAVEIIYSMGTEDIDYEQGNDWSIVTSDHSISACFEHTVAVRENVVEVIT